MLVDWFECYEKVADGACLGGLGKIAFLYFGVGLLLLLQPSFDTLTAWSLAELPVLVFELKVSCFVCRREAFLQGSKDVLRMRLLVDDEREIADRD